MQMLLCCATWLRELLNMTKELGCPNPQIVLHLDHGDTFETCKAVSIQDSLLL